MNEVAVLCERLQQEVDPWARARQGSSLHAFLALTAALGDCVEGNFTSDQAELRLGIGLAMVHLAEICALSGYDFAAIYRDSDPEDRCQGPSEIVRALGLFSAAHLMLLEPKLRDQHQAQAFMEQTVVAGILRTLEALAAEKNLDFTVAVLSVWEETRNAG